MFDHKEPPMSGICAFLSAIWLILILALWGLVAVFGDIVFVVVGQLAAACVLLSLGGMIFERR